MKFSADVALLVGACLSTTSAHTLMTTFSINNVNQGDGTCVRMPMTPSNATDPINDLTSEAMACGYGGSQGVARVCPVTQGATLSFQFRDTPNNASIGSIDPSHKGPCSVWMKSVTSAIDDAAVGDGWFKIAEEGYDNSTSQWCTEKIIQNKGILETTIPSDITGGYYLVRTELLALHQADKTPPNPQFYVGCAQIFLTSNGTAAPSQLVSIPGYTNISDPTVLFNIYIPHWPYTPPGPARYMSGVSHATQAKVIVAQQEGSLPSNVVAVNANWWGIELDSYYDAAGCWNASSNCFNQTTTCYASAPPTGSTNCHIWESKCDAIQAGCNAGTFTGPPDHGKILTPGCNGTGSNAGSPQSSSLSDTAGASSTSQVQLPLPATMASVMSAGSTASCAEYTTTSTTTVVVTASAEPSVKPGGYGKGRRGLKHGHAHGDSWLW